MTALFGCGLSAWLAGAILAAEPAAQADMATVALGGRGGRARADAVLVAAIATVLTVVFISYPLALGLVREHVFDRTPGAADVGAAILVQLACCAAGGALGALLAALAAVLLAAATAWGRRRA